MNVKALRTGVAAAMGGAVLLAGLLVGASIALADDDPAVTSEDSTATESERPARGWHGAICGTVDEVLEEIGVAAEDFREMVVDGMTIDEIATELGIDLDEVVADVKDKALEAIDEKVAEGVISEERAATMKDRIESFDLDSIESRLEGVGERVRGFMGDMLGRGGFGGFGLGDLELDVSELRDLITDGLTMDEALEELGIDIEAMMEEAQAGMLEHIEEMVADGRISQEQADQMIERLESMDLSEGFSFGTRGFRGDCDGDGEGFRGGRGFGHGIRGDDGSTSDLNSEEALLDV